MRNIRTVSPVCAEGDEIDRAQQRKDKDALRSEFDGDSNISDDDMKTLRDYIGVIEEKEENLEGMKAQFRVFEAQTGVQFISDDGDFMATAWVFVALNVLVALYAGKILLADPLQQSISGSAGGGWPL